MQRLLNPPGSAYRSETGGLMEALRVLTVEQSKCMPLLPLYSFVSRAPTSPGISPQILRPSQSDTHCHGEVGFGHLISPRRCPNPGRTHDREARPSQRA